MLHLYLYIIIKKFSIICSSETRADDILNNKSYNFQIDSSNVIVQVAEACKEIELKIYLRGLFFLTLIKVCVSACVFVCVRALVYI